MRTLRDKRELSRVIRSELEMLRFRETAFLPLLAGNPSRRIGYQAVNQVAYKMFGVGGYRLRGVPGGVTVARVGADA